MDHPSFSSPSASNVTKKNPRGMGAAITFLAIAGAIIPGFLLFFWPDYQQGKILKTGLPAQATVLDIRPTGNVYNSQPQVELTLRVQPPNEEPYEAKLKMVINPVYLPQFQPQKQLRVHYDPNDKTRVAVDEE